MEHTWSLQLNRCRQWLTKRRVTGLSLIAICLAVCAYGTAAYFTAESTAHNIITTGGIGIQVVETMESYGTEVDFPAGGLSGIMPGEQVSKIVKVKNNDMPAYIRVKVDASIVSSTGAALSADVMTYDIDTAHWVNGGDGYYYYKTPVSGSGTSTEALFRTVRFSPAMDNSYQNCVASIKITAQAVQVQNNQAPVDANGNVDVLQIKGWPTDA